MSGFVLDWKQVALGCTAIVALAAVLIFAPANVKEAVVEWLGWGVAAINAFLGPAIRRKQAEAEHGDA